LRNDIDNQVDILIAKSTDYPYVVASGRECVSSRGSILVFLSLAGAIACRQEMNRIEADYFGSTGTWKVKRLAIDQIQADFEIFDDLVQKKQVPVKRDFSKRWSKWGRLN